MLQLFALQRSPIKQMLISLHANWRSLQQTELLQITCLAQSPVPTAQVRVLSLSPTKMFGNERKRGSTGGEGLEHWVPEARLRTLKTAACEFKVWRGSGVRGQSGCTLPFKNYPGVSINYETNSASDLNSRLWLSPLTSNFRTVTTKPWAIHGAWAHRLHVVPLA